MSLTVDEIPWRMLKDDAKILVEPISQIVIMSLGSKISKGCKTAKVKIIFKKGKNIEPQNYRPVLPLPVMSIVNERVLHKPANRTPEKYEIIFDYQSNFKSKNSVNTCLVPLSNQALKGFKARKQENQQT